MPQVEIIECSTAGITLDEINGSQTSVYCGSFTNDYNMMTVKDLTQYPKYSVTGTGNAILSNRISYYYNLHGPSMTLDTACSSSLYVHLVINCALVRAAVPEGKAFPREGRSFSLVFT